TTRSATSFRSLNLAFRHPLDTYRLSDRHCKNRFPFSSRTGWRSPRRVSVRRLGRERGSEFLEARIISERIKHRIEPEQRRSERHVCGIKRAFVRCREQLLQSAHSTLGLAHFRGHAGKDLD